MNLKHYLTPTWITAYFLTALYGMAIVLRGEEGFFINELGRAGAAALGFVLVHFIGIFRWQSKPSLPNLVITTLILLLLASPSTSFLMMAVLGLLTGLVKTVARITHEPIFNPAAAGLFLASFLSVSTSWWGVSFAPRLPFFNMSAAGLLTIPIGVYILWLYKKIPTLVAVPVTLSISYFVLTGRWPLTLLLEGTFAFFLLIMASEPKTTPVVDWQEWLYGAMLGGLLGFLFVNRLVGDPYLISLLGMNGVFAAFRYLRFRRVSS